MRFGRPAECTHSVGQVCVTANAADRGDLIPHGSGSCPSKSNSRRWRWLPPSSIVLADAVTSVEQVWGILDGAKWERSALLPFISTNDLAGIITDSSAPMAEVKSWRAAGVDVIVAAAVPMEPLQVHSRDLRTTRVIPVWAND